MRALFVIAGLYIACALFFGHVLGRYAQPVPPAPACSPVVWNPLWSQNPHGIGDRTNDRRRLTREERIATLEAQLQDPYRSPIFDSELRREIARLKKGRS